MTLIASLPNAGPTPCRSGNQIDLSCHGLSMQKPHQLKIFRQIVGVYAPAVALDQEDCKVSRQILCIHTAFMRPEIGRLEGWLRHVTHGHCPKRSAANVMKADP